MYEKLTNNTELDYNGFEEIVLNLLSSQAQVKKKMVRANQRVFMKKEIHKAIMVRSRLRNEFIKEKTAFSREAYNKQRNYCVKLIRESKIKYFSNLNVKNITDTKTFWKTVGSNFSRKKPINENILLWEKNRLVTDEKSIAKVFNDYFTSIIKHLHIERKEFDSKNVKFSNNAVSSVVNKFQNHPYILKIKSSRTYSSFSFRPVNYKEVLTELKNLDMSKTTQLEGISTEIVKENLNIFATFLVKDINTCIRKEEFPDKLKRPT